MIPRLNALGIIRFIAIGLLTMALGCSLDYGSALADDLSEGMPDTVVLGFEHTVVDNSFPRFRLEAERAESYQAQRMMKLQGVKFYEFVPGGTELSSEGRADSAILHTDTESAEFSGGVLIRSIRDGITVQSGYLEWDGEARMLKSRAETVTSINDDDGSSLAGSGFTADAARRSFSFRNRVDGTFVAPETSVAPEANMAPETQK